MPLVQERSATERSSYSRLKRQFASEQGSGVATLSDNLPGRHSRAQRAHDAGRKIQKLRIELAEEHFARISAALADSYIETDTAVGTALETSDGVDLSGLALCRKLSDATDTCIEEIFAAAVGIDPSTGPSDPSSSQETSHSPEREISRQIERFRTAAKGSATLVALVATGGYGRKEVCPYSDIDLTICYLPGVKGIKEISAAILYPLWDSGLKVGHSVVTPKEAVAIASSELDTTVSHLDSRHIIGAPSLFQELSERIESLVAKRRKRILQDILEKRKRRINALPVFDGLRWGAGYLGADLKLGSGGLRDLCSIEWVAKCLGLDLTEVLSPEDQKILLRAKSDLLLLRSALHLCYRRSQDVLDTSAVTRLQARFGEVLAKCITQRALQAAVATEVLVERNLCLLVNDAKAQARRLSPTMMLPQVLKASAVSNARVPDEASGQTAKRQPTNADDARSQLLRVLQAPLDEILEKGRFLQAYGIMQKAIPHWKNIEGLYQSDQYHTFTVDVHSWATLSRLLYVFQKAVLDTPGIWPSMLVEHLTELVESADSERALTLRLACLLHDIGKGLTARAFRSNSNSTSEHSSHAKIGSHIAHQVAIELGYSDDSAKRCAHLVLHHLVLAEAALKRDFQDPATVEAVHNALENPSLLDDLYLLTLADASATGPQVWNSWRRSLVTQLYMACRARPSVDAMGRHALASADRDQIIAEFENALRRAGVGESVARHLSKASPLSLTASIASRMPTLELTAAALARHLREGGAPAVEARDIGDSYYELVVVAQDTPGLFAKIAGCTALSSMSVVSAQAHSLETQPRIAVDLFFVHTLSGKLSSEEGLSELQNQIRLVIAGKIALSYRLGLKTTEWRQQLDAQARRAGSFKVMQETTKERKVVYKLDSDKTAHEAAELSALCSPHSEPLIHIDNASSKNRTIIEVQSQNRPRLLYDIARTLAELGLDIRAAKIATLAETAADVFYVVDSSGSKVEDPEHIREVRNALTHALSSGL